jgi:hypothetical protein
MDLLFHAESAPAMGSPSKRLRGAKMPPESDGGKRKHKTVARSQSVNRALAPVDSGITIEAMHFLARAMIWASLPHSEVDGHVYKRDNGICSITMLADPDLGLPYGKLPRLILTWVTTEASRTGQRQLNLGRSLAEFACKLGLSTGGGKRGDATRLREQATRLFNTFVTLKSKKDHELEYRNVVLSDQGLILWNPAKPHERNRWPSTITLSERFFQECTQHAVPIDINVLKKLRSPFAIDIYCWLTWRMNNLKDSPLIPWEKLRWQFGSNYACDGARHTLDFQKSFRKHLTSVKKHYPLVRAVTQKEGLRLFPSQPHVRRLPSSSGG